MDKLKEKIFGIVVVIALAVIFVPMLLTEGTDHPATGVKDIPAPPEVKAQDNTWKAPESLSKLQDRTAPMPIHNEGHDQVIHDLPKQQEANAKLAQAQEKAHQEKLLEDKRIEEQKLLAKKAEEQKNQLKEREEEERRMSQAEKDELAQAEAKEREEKAKMQRDAQLKAEQASLAQKNQAQEKLAKQRAEQEKIAQVKLEQVKLAEKKSNQEKLAKKQTELKLAQAEKEKLEKDKLANEKAVKAKVEKDKAAKDKAAKENAEKGKPVKSNQAVALNAEESEHDLEEDKNADQDVSEEEPEAEKIVPRQATSHSLHSKRMRSSAEGKGWVIQLGTFAVHHNAQVLVEKVKAAGYPAYLVKTRRHGQAVTLVMVGPQVSRQETEEWKSILNSKFSIDGIIVHYNSHESEMKRYSE